VRTTVASRAIRVERESVRQDDRPTSRAPDDSVGSGTLAKRSIDLPGGRTAIAVFAPHTVSGEEAATALELSRPRGLIVLNGGTADLSPDLDAALRRTLGEGLARVAINEGLTVVTGGTDAGVFALFGGALDDERSAPCIGVVPAGRVTWPGRERPSGRMSGGEEPVPLEPHHSHFLLVAGDDWGTETDAMVALSEALSGNCPSLAVLAGGGAGARREVLAHLRAGREVIVLDGTGRFAERLAEASAGRGESAEETAEMVASGLITVVDAAEPPSTLAHLVRSRLIPGSAEAQQ
jgi:SLOG in TRPM, prokaryote